MYDFISTAILYVSLILSGSMYGFRLFAIGILVLAGGRLHDYFCQTKPYAKLVHNMMYIAGIIGGMDILYSGVSAIHSLEGIAFYSAIVSGLLALAGLFLIFVALSGDEHPEREDLTQK